MSFDLIQLKEYSTAISIVVIPMVLAIVGNNYTKAIKEREVQSEFVKISIDILREEPSEKNKNLREWAIQIIDRYSGVTMEKGARTDLIENIRITSMDFGLEYNSKMATDINISQVQRDLKTLNYYKGEITGTADSLTVEAIVKFQKDIGIVADGAAGPLTLSKLRQKAHEVESAKDNGGKKK